MSADGKQLEGLVAFVEKTLLPQGFDVKTNECIYNDEGIQIAEFDIQVRGRMGSTNIAWLIECRDRPGSGPAPGSWIEQLVGRRARFKFNKVTAVSTTGFAAGAIDFAKVEGIELREVRTLTPDQFSDWLVMRDMLQIENLTRLNHAQLKFQNSDDPSTLEAVNQSLTGNDGNSNILRSILNNEFASLSSAFLGAVNSQKTLFEGMDPNDPGRPITLHVQYINDEDHYVLDTTIGPVRVREIIFEGELLVKERLIPLTVTAEYRDVESGEKISQIASFSPHIIQGVQFSFEMHHMADSGQTHLVLRRLGQDV